MTPQELKNSILQLAIQGRLVEQNKGEKSPDLSDIKSITTDELDFDLPVSWKTAHLESITISIPAKKYQILESEVQKTGIYPVISQSKEYSIGYSDDENKVFHHVKPVIVFGDHTTVIKYVEFDFIVGADGIKIFEPLYHLLSPKYLFYVMEYYAIGLEKVGGYSRHYKYIKNKPIPIPPLAEQKRIVAKIEELLPLIDRYEKAWSRLEEFNKQFPKDMQKSILQMAIQGKLVEQRAEEGTGEELYQQIQAEKQNRIRLGELKRTKALPHISNDMLPVSFPDTWKICYMDDIAFVTKLAGFEYSTFIAPNLSKDGIPLFKGKNVQNGKLVLNFESYIPEHVSNELLRSQITKKCLLTPYVGTIGNISIFDGQFKAHLGSNVGKIELLNGKKKLVLEEYVLHYLRSPMGYSELTKFKKATAQESISIDAIRNVIIPIPPLEEQKRIVSKLEELLPLCEQLNGGIK